MELALNVKLRTVSTVHHLSAHVTFADKDMSSTAKTQNVYHVELVVKLADLEIFLNVLPASVVVTSFK